MSFKNTFKKIGFFILICFSLLSSYGQTATAPAGAGTSANPYQIATLENLYWISQNSGEWGSGKHYIQTADIDAAATSTWFSGEGFPTIATTPYFYGVYDGNGKIISNLHMDRSSGSYGGLFGIVSGANAVIKDLGLVNLNYSFETGSTGSYVGGIVARPVTNSKIERCFTTGNITHSGGTNSATGGIAGYGSTSPSITESWSSVHINSTSPNNDRFIGGIIGWLATGSVEDCYYTGNLNWSSNNTMVGGIIGFLNAYQSPADISRCYSIADFIGSAGTTKGAVVGGTVAEASASDGVFFDNDLISLDGIGEINTQYGSFNGSIDGKSTSNMKIQSNYPDWDFTQIWGIDPTINDGYPHLLQNLPYNPCDNFAAEAPTLDNGVYQISTFNHLSWISENSSSWGADFIQTADIDAAVTSESCYNSGAGWLPIGNVSTKFTGSYNGDGHTISNLFINRPNEQRIALFGETDGATIERLGIVDPDITVTGTGFFGQGSNVGSLVGLADNGTSISECFATGGSVSAGGSGVGGLIGQLLWSSLTDSYAIVAVEGGDADINYSGGLVGVNSSSTITNCYAAGSVAFKQYSTGFGFVTVSRGLTQGSNGITNSFYDSDATGQTTGGGTAKTTVEMQQQATFTNWDFQCEAANGTANIWGIDEGNDYPVLSQFGFNQSCPCDISATAPASGDGLSASTAYEIASFENLLWITEDSTRWDKYYIQTSDIDAGATKTNENCFDTEGWSPIGNADALFTGSYNGQGYTISNLYIDRTSSLGVGLFGWVETANISNLELSNGEVRGQGRTAVIIGRADDSSLSGLSASGTAYGADSGYSQVGGIVGYLVASDVSVSYSSVTIDSNGGSLGSLVGYSTFDSDNGSSITNSYATGAVTSQNDSDFVGGLTGGLANSSVTNSYATGAVTSTASSNVGGLVGGDNGTSGGSSVTNSFYDTETSGLNVSAIGGSGKTTAEMQQASTFLEANWDFTSSNEIWGINQNDNNSYPFLRYQDNVSDSDHIYLGTSTGLLTNPSSWSEASVPTSLTTVRIPSKVASNNISLEVDEDFEIATLFIENEDGNLVVLPTKSIKVNGNITNNGQITFKSDATGDSYLDEFTGSITGTGDVVVEKYYPAKRAFRMVASPVNGSSLFDNWQNGGANETGIGTHITGDNTGTEGEPNSTTGLDYSATGNPSMFFFDNGWQAVTNTNNTNLEVGKPYRLMVRGDRGIDLDSNESFGETTLISTGTLQVGNIAPTFPSATTSGDNPTTFAFIANPYQSRIDVSEVLAANSNTDSNQLWVWDPDVNTRGGFVTIDQLSTGNGAATPLVGSGTSQATKFIEPGQAFFIQLTDSDSEISFTESVKDNITSLKPAPFSDNQMSMLLDLKNENNQIIDAIRLRFAADGITEIDAADIAKMGNIDENLASVNENSLFTIQRRNFPENDEVIPLFTNNWRNQDYSFMANLNNFGTTAVYLVDDYLGTETLLEDGQTYSFNVD
ncbi:hypothetical protein G7034_07885, partial [Psychroflexus sp. C1]|nr:hypothetical protein [Psychroflexus maritimus]